jgi:hypothetical protein
MPLGNRTLSDIKGNLARYEAMVAKRRSEGQDLYIVRDSALGWRMQPNAHHPRWPYTTNELGNRASWSQDVADVTPARQVAILGNSHVHGDEAPDAETWVAQAQTKLGADWRVHNLGVSAYATDQAILHFLDFQSRHPVDFAVLAITTTEIYRNLNQCRAFMMEDREIPIFKPRFVDDAGALRLADIPIRGDRPLADELDDPAVLAALRRDDAFFPSYATQLRDIARRMHLPLATIYQRLYEPALKLTIALCHHFVASCRDRGVQPAIMFLPVFWGSFPAGPEYDRLAAALGNDVPLIDARSAFTPDRLALSRDILHHRANHYTARSAGWVAEHVATSLKGLV